MAYDPSKPLKDPRRERFAQLVSDGRTAAEAFAEAGYKPDPNNACRLARHPEVKARIEWLKGAVARQVVVRAADAGAKRAEAQAEQVIAAKHDRDEVLRKLWENAMIAKGEVPVTVFRAVKKKIKDDDGGYVETIEAVAIQVTQRDAAAANQALIAYGKEVGMTFDGAPPADVAKKADVLTNMSNDEYLDMAEREVNARAARRAKARTTVGNA